MLTEKNTESSVFFSFLYALWYNGIVPKREKKESL